MHEERKDRGRGRVEKGEGECEQKLVTTRGSSSVLLALLHPGLGGGVQDLVCSSVSKFCAERCAQFTRCAAAY